MYELRKRKYDQKANTATDKKHVAVCMYTKEGSSWMRLETT